MARFYDGPIDNEDDGPEGLINAWPLDETFIDYVDGAPDAASSTSGRLSRDRRGLLAAS